jgi:HEAT repeat protein
MENQEDHEILMHRQAHFGGSFDVMQAYYANQEKGALLEADRIKQMADYEKQLGEDLAEMLLTPGDHDLLEKINELYQQLRELCEMEGPKTQAPQMIAELILSEQNEEEGAMMAFTPAHVPQLIDLLRAQEFSNPLFPGYGLAPTLAAETLGRLKATEAIAPLFEAVDGLDETLSEEAFDALLAIGEPVRPFLHKVLDTDTFTTDLERAASLLSAMPPNPETATLCKSLLERDAIRTREPLASYLALCV